MSLNTDAFIFHLWFLYCSFMQFITLSDVFLLFCFRVSAPGSRRRTSPRRACVRSATSCCLLSVWGPTWRLTREYTRINVTPATRASAIASSIKHTWKATAREENTFPQMYCFDMEQTKCQEPFHVVRLFTYLRGWYRLLRVDFNKITKKYQS